MWLTRLLAACHCAAARSDGDEEVSSSSTRSSRGNVSASAQGNTEKKKEKKKKHLAYSMVRHSITDSFYEESGPRDQYDHLYNPEVHSHGLMTYAKSRPTARYSSSGEVNGSSKKSNDNRVALKDFTF